ncbi:cryptochrome/photolyase family protein [Aeoliella mucimassa]|uniref:Deoxyribodipyrimidine photo-lyase-related protein n=1 Tax=Aeoliella mucimassa TaxID=2527972 RepID=A0A518ATF8_9BACT|nr:cryptochrome/photolyase family protein [Aeoliella mucimassa]QDU58020.1 Deoxyribodipyrimidine photo-lyase-related protein [Aeoliella mucimassa]
MGKQVRHLMVVFGDQLNLNSAIWDDIDPDRDLAWMAEVTDESTRTWSHKVRIAVFLSAMRHFHEALEQNGIRVRYQLLDDDAEANTLLDCLAVSIKKEKPERVVAVEPGEWWLRQGLIELCDELTVPLDLLPDRHFMCTHDEFEQHAKGRKQLRMEYFYREMRKRYEVLLDDGEPEGGDWNYDSSNRKSFGKSGPGKLPAPRTFKPDKITQQVCKHIEALFPDHPGNLEHFDWPVTAEQAEQALRDFIKHRLPDFGDHQDAMWTDEPWLYHSRISAAMNLKLLDPRDVIKAAEQAYRAGDAPLNSVEGFIRQVLGWREYVRGVYWLHMPGYLERNAMSARQPLPEFYWTGETEMYCLSQAIGQTLEYGYAHHIQRLMVTGLFALLLGVDPHQVHQWYLAVYVDAVEWVEAPNTIGMSQYADEGVMASKPYVASGKYIKRMSNYCQQCVFDPDQAVGEQACPFTTLYWDYLNRNEKQLSSNRRMTLQLRNLEKKSDKDLSEIKKQAEAWRAELSDQH